MRASRWFVRLVGGMRGQGLVEFALAIPVLLLLTAGIIDFGRGVAAYAQLSNCAREGARAGIWSVTPDAEIESAVRSHAQLLGSIDSIIITPSTRVQDGFVRVTVNYTYKPIIGILVSAIGSAVPMTATSEMVVEW